MTRVLELLLTTLVIALIVSVSFNLYDYYVVLPQMQTDTNIRKTNALKGWLLEMNVADDALKAAKTNDDIQQASGNDVGFAQYFATILGGGPSEKLYTSVETATYWLNEGLMAMYFGNETGAIYQRNLNQAELSMIANLTDNLYGLLIRSASLPNHTYPYLEDWLDYGRNMTNMDPAQQLQEVGVNMTNVLGYLDQITSVSRQIIAMYPNTSF